MKSGSLNLLESTPGLLRDCFAFFYNKIVYEIMHRINNNNNNNNTKFDSCVLLSVWPTTAYLHELQKNKQSVTSNQSAVYKTNKKPPSKLKETQTTPNIKPILNSTGKTRRRPYPPNFRRIHRPHIEQTKPLSTSPIKQICNNSFY